MHGEERVDRVRDQRLAEEAIGVRHGLGLCQPEAVESVAHDEHAARGEKAPPGDLHARPPWAGDRIRTSGRRSTIGQTLPQIHDAAETSPPVR